MILSILAFTILVSNAYALDFISSNLFKRKIEVEKSNPDSLDSELLLSIQSEIDVLRQNLSRLEVLEITKSWPQLSEDYMRVLDDVAQLSFQNLTLMTWELSMYLKEDEENEAVDQEEDFSLPDIINTQETMGKINDTIYIDNVAMDEAIDAVKGSERKAKEMVEKALQTLNSLKQEAIHVATSRIQAEKQNFEMILSGFLLDAKHTKRTNVMGKEADHNSNLLLENETWVNAGYKHTNQLNEISNSSTLIDLFLAVPLKRYSLGNDTKKDVLVNRVSSGDEMRTRSHIGIIDKSFAKVFIHPFLYHEGKWESNLLNNLNLMVLSDLADEVDSIRAKMKALKICTKNDSKLSLSIKRLAETIQYSENFESISDLAAQVGSLEAELTTKNMKVLLQNIRNTLKLQRESTRIKKMISIINADARSYIAENTIKMKDKSSLQRHTFQRDGVLSSIIATMSLLNDIFIGFNETMGELSQLYRSSQHETLSVIAQINVDAEKERMSESVAMESIRIVGEEARVAIVHMVEIIFEHIVHALMHILTKGEGRHQILIFVLTVSVLIFSITFCKELIKVIFNLMTIFISKPRLVREWGSFVSCPEDQSRLSDIVLPVDERERLYTLCRSINSNRNKCAPLRNILIYGKAGTGKSMIARAIAESSLGMSYAVMSGADIAPLKHLGPSELRNVLSWANSRRGIIIIDEAESAFGKRVRKQQNTLTDKTNENSISMARDALNVFLTLTGDTHGRAMIILTTSSPEALDEAVLDRCDDLIHCSLPGESERIEILSKELAKKFHTGKGNFVERDFFQKGKTNLLKVDKSLNIQNMIKQVSQDNMSFGFSGRELCKMVRAIESAVFASGNNLLTPSIWNMIVKDSCLSIQNKKQLHSTKSDSHKYFIKKI